MSFTIERNNKLPNRGKQEELRLKTITKKSGDTRHNKLPKSGKTFSEGNQAKGKILQKSSQRWSGKGGKLMFPTDNEARKNEITNRDVKEKIRHNKVNEELTKRGQNTALAGQITGSALRSLGSVAKVFNHPS